MQLVSERETAEQDSIQKEIYDSQAAESNSCSGRDRTLIKSTT